MIEIPKCQTCRRQPSQRDGQDEFENVTICPDPIHDAADLGPAAVALLRKWQNWHSEGAYCSPRDHACDLCVPGGPLNEQGFRCHRHATDALLASLVKP